MMTPAEITECARLLSKLEPGFLPIEIFSEMCRIGRTPTFILAPLRYDAGGQLEIGVLKRSKEERFWPGQWHLPGTVIRSNDTEETVLERLLSKEIGAIKYAAPVFRKALFHTTERGTEIILLHTLGEIETDPDSPLAWSRVDALPEPFLESEKIVVNHLLSAIQESR